MFLNYDPVIVYSDPLKANCFLKFFRCSLARWDFVFWRAWLTFEHLVCLMAWPTFLQQSLDERMLRHASSQQLLAESIEENTWFPAVNCNCFPNLNKTNARWNNRYVITSFILGSCSISSTQAYGMKNVSDLGFSFWKRRFCTQEILWKTLLELTFTTTSPKQIADGWWYS